MKNAMGSTISMLMPTGIIKKITIPDDVHIMSIGKKLLNFDDYASAYALVSGGNMVKIGETIAESVFESRHLGKALKVKTFDSVADYLTNLIRCVSNFIFVGGEWYFLLEDNTLYKVSELIHDYQFKEDTATPYTTAIFNIPNIKDFTVKKVAICRSTGTYIGYVDVGLNVYKVRACYAVNGGAVINPKTVKVSSSKRIIEDAEQYDLSKLVPCELPSGETVYIYETKNDDF